MSSKNKVTLTFAGDAGKLEKAFDEVGASANDMKSEVSSASASFDGLGDGIDNTGSKAGDLESGFQGITDSMSGMAAIAQGDVLGGLADLAGGAEGLATSFTGVLVPAMKGAVTWLKNTKVGTLATAAASKVARGAAIAWAAAQRVLNFVLAANPIGLVIVALVAIGAALVIAWKKSETFRRIVTGTWRAISSGAQWLWERIKGIWGNITGFLGATARRIGGFFSGMWNGITEGLRSALNGAIWLINGLVNGVNWLIGGFNALPGPDLPTIPNIPTLHTGGIVPGAPGSETLALLQAGERVTRAGATPKTVALVSDGSALSDLIVRTLRETVRREGGNVQFVLGQG